jgi:hypothetical protein
MVSPVNKRVHRAPCPEGVSKATSAFRNPPVEILEQSVRDQPRGAYGAFGALFFENWDPQPQVQSRNKSGTFST